MHSDGDFHSHLGHLRGSGGDISSRIDLNSSKLYRLVNSDAENLGDINSPTETDEDSYSNDNKLLCNADTDIASSVSCLKEVFSRDVFNFLSWSSVLIDGQVKALS